MPGAISSPGSISCTCGLHRSQAFLSESHILDELVAHRQGIGFLRPVFPFAPRHQLLRPRENQRASPIDPAANVIEVPMRQHNDIDITRLIAGRRQSGITLPRCEWKTEPPPLSINNR